MDKDFTQKKVLADEFPNSKVLLCIFHVIKAVKTEIAKQNICLEEKQKTLDAFRSILYSTSDEAVKENENRLFSFCSDLFAKYYRSNWGNIVELWCFAFRIGLQTLGNNTTNRIERFFLTIKTSLKSSGHSISKRFHLSECIELIMDTVNTKKNSSHYFEFVNTVKVLKLHEFPLPEIANEVGKCLTLFAAKVVRAQCQLLVKETYKVTQVLGSWKVENIQSQRSFDVEIGPNDSLSCTCYTNCSFGIPCRHIMKVREQNGQSCFNQVDVLPKWLRNSSKVNSEFDFYQPLVAAAEKGIPDEEILDVENIKSSNCFTKLGSRYRAISDVTNELAQEISRFGSSEFHLYLNRAQKFLNIVREGKIPIVLTPDPDEERIGTDTMFNSIGIDVSSPIQHSFPIHTTNTNGNFPR